MMIGKFTTGSIASIQGVCFPSNPTTLPGNDFSQTCGAAKDLDAFNNTYQVSYRTRSVGNELPPIGCYSTAGYMLTNCIGVGTGPVCPPSAGGGNNNNFTASEVFKKAINDIKQEIKQRENTLNKGNSSSLYDVISSGNENQVKNKLLDKSPYLSDGVLLPFLQHLPTFSENTIKDVIIANSPVTSTVMAAINNLSLSASVQSQINSAQVGISPRSELMTEIQYFKDQRFINYNYLLSVLLNDRITMRDLIP